MRKVTFDSLREANKMRLPLFKNKHGEPAHSRPDGSDWTPAQWLQATMGELGEYANKRKKYERGDMTHAEFASEAAKELADVQTYLDILALRCLDVPGRPHATGVDLGAATVDKFNEVSSRVKADVWMGHDGSVSGPDPYPEQATPQIVYSRDNEDFKFFDLEDILGDMDNDGLLKTGALFFEADYEMLQQGAFDSCTESILDVFDDQLYELVGEASIESFNAVSQEARQELTSLLRGWISRNVQVGEYFTIVGKSRMCVVQEEDAANSADARQPSEAVAA